MTDVYVEHLCEHCGVVRVGANAPFPAPYLYSVTYVIRGAYAEPVGFDHPGAKPSEFKAVITAINKATGKLVAYDRAGVPPTRIVQIDPRLTKGKIVMTVEKQPINHVDAAREGAGFSHGTIVEHAKHALEQIEAGHATIVDAGQEDLGGGKTKVWFVRQE